MGERCSDECLFHWAAVVKWADTPWERQFAQEIAKKAEKPWWRPTVRQLAIMRRMVDSVFYGDSSEVIEDDRRQRVATTRKGGPRAA